MAAGKNNGDDEEASLEPHSLVLGESGNEVAEIPLHYMTRHGIIAGTTGTGKSRAMQVLAEQLTDADISVFVSDVKGDASGFCVQGEESERNKLAPYPSHALKANYWSVSGRFARMRFSIQEIGSILFSRLLALNPTQESHLSIAFSYARKKGLPLDTTAQLLDILDELVTTGQRGISPSSISVIQRTVIALEESGLGAMFGKPSLRAVDLLGLNVLNLSDARKDMAVALAPAFILQKLFDSLPEVGDVEKPEIVIFFDEAHYLFKESNRSLRDLMVTVLKQIRSKGVSVFFVTQDVTDIPDEILGQLSTKIIFAQKPMTEKGNSRLKALVKSFPNPKPETYETIKKMPPGTALLSTLDDDGNQTEPAVVKIFAPASTMAIVPDPVLRKATDPELIQRYAKPETQNAKPKKVAPPAVVDAPARPVAASPQKAKEAGGKEVRVREVIVEKKAVKPSGPSSLDRFLGALLSLLRFIIKAVGMVLDALVMKPAKSLFKYLTKKPIRILYLLIALLSLYFLIINWALIASMAEKLKVS
ncbi:MAG: helicase HerA-like domain-containing protein [Candidatus Micrarchaeota archaeon]